MYAEVLVEYPTKKIDKFFTYIIPFHLREKLKVGMKVQVFFGNKIINGFVMNISNTFKESYELKEIIDIIDEELSLNEELMNLGKYISENTLSPLILAYQAMLPSSLKIKNKKSNYNSYDSIIKLNKDRNTIISYLKEYNKENKQSELLKELLNNDLILKKDCSNHVINALREKGLIKEEKVQKYRIQKDKNINVIKHQLNSEQQNVFDKIANINNNTVFLLEGVTGSGKTEVYLHLIEKVLNDEKNAILLLPEITLTMQVVNKFYDWFGSKVAIFHSALSDGEKNDEFLKILRGEVSVVIGTRSAIFAPLKNIGIIIIDEEHSDTYKQDNTPKYNAIDIAKERTKFHNCPLVLGSATPTLESRSRAIKGVYEHLYLTKRAGEGRLPNVEIVDMLPEVKKGNFIISEVLKNKINEKLNKNEQVIILLNRRGYSTVINCSSCGYTYKCPHCDITLTFHKSVNNLRCHYCGYTKYIDNLCPQCKEPALNYLGMGTEKVEAFLKDTFKTARIVRMDQDTTTKKGSHEKIINDFKNHEYDILLGTQMISKGLDFPLVTLVGVINADSSLNIPDFRSNERTFSLLYQSSGRAGRSDLSGEVIIQTFNPDNEILKCVQNNDFNSFYDYEMNIRRIMKYPPYYFLVSLKVISKDYESALKNATKICDYLKNNLDKTSIILGPTTANVFKLNNNYRFQIVIKYRFDKFLYKVLSELDNMYKNENNVLLDFDINPIHI